MTIIDEETGDIDDFELGHRIREEMADVARQRTSEFVRYLRGVFSQDFSSEITKRERRNLLIATGAILAVSVFHLTPSSIPLFQVELDAESLTNMMQFLFLIEAYLVLAFLTYLGTDILRVWEKDVEDKSQGRLIDDPVRRSLRPVFQSMTLQDWIRVFFVRPVNFFVALYRPLLEIFIPFLAASFAFATGWHIAFPRA